MILNLTHPFASNGKADATDVRAMKKALNRLGYYVPFDKVGITDIADAAVFAGLKNFQRDHGLPQTGAAKPGDATVTALNTALATAPDGLYIWRTVEDGKVRAAHAQYNRTKRKWSDAPDPGDDYNCRCWAEAVTQPMKLEQEIINPIIDFNQPWTNLDFVSHFYFGDGQAVTLTEAGLLGMVVEHARKMMFDNVVQEITQKARIVQNGGFAGSWENSYSFGGVIFSLGGATIKGRFTGTVRKEEKILAVDAQVEYEFLDTFTDPLNKRQKETGSSSLDVVPYNFSKSWWSPENIGAAYYTADTEYMGTPYDISGSWKTKVFGSISTDE
jgi:peptidoglycan hydrolase-like protein with peptidoglycan-binding domain